MNFKDLARKIPDNVRSQRIICVSDPIANATTSPANYAMNLLFEAWYTFIEPHGEKKINCPWCRENILRNFQSLKPALIELEKEYQLLKEIT